MNSIGYLNTNPKEAWKENVVMNRRSAFVCSLVAAGAFLMGAMTPQSAEAAIMFFTTELDGSQVQPTPVATQATGTGIIQFDTVSHLLTVQAVVRGISSSDLNPVSSTSSAIHLHDPSGTSIFDVINNVSALQDTASGFFVHAQSVVAPSVAAAIEAGNFSIDIHTLSAPGGEIRGDIASPVVIIPVIPEPSTVALMGIGVALLATARRRRRVLGS